MLCYLLFFSHGEPGWYRNIARRRVSITDHEVQNIEDDHSIWLHF
jgi:hypothetical protein